MQKEIDPQVEALLDELTEDSYLVRQKQIVKLLEPYFDTILPLLIERLQDQSDNCHIRHNAIKVLALSSDPRSVLPLIRQIEIEAGWASTVFDYLRQGLADKDNISRQKINQQLIKYLEEGSKIPLPEPLNPVAKEESFNDFVGALMKLTGVTELDDESQKLASEAKQIWMQPRDTTEDEKHKTRNIQDILVQVIETLSQFGGLSDPRLGELLAKYIKEYGFDSHVTQHALTALSKTGPLLAIAHLNELATYSVSPPDTLIKRVVGRKVDDDATCYEFTICIRKPDTEKWKEHAYYFIYEQGFVFLFARGPLVEKWFVGQATNQEDAVQLASKYLGRWMKNIDSLARIEDRYAECIHVVQQYIDFEKWGFQQTYIGQVYDYPYERPQVIYDSEWCRVKISFRSYGEMYNQSDVLIILYGRLHAANREHTVLWNGEHHQCWHDVSLALCFLDDMSPEEAAKVLWNHPVMAEYKASKSGSQPAIVAGMHAAIWERYGVRLFQLFDLRRPNLWENYRAFLEQVYEIIGFKHSGRGVSPEKIC